MNSENKFSPRRLSMALLMATTSGFVFADNTTLGTDAGANLSTSAEGNTLIGESAGKSIVTSDNNTFIGAQAGMANTSGSDNVFLGHQSGLVNVACSDNTFAGFQTGLANCTSGTSGSDNTFFGYESGLANTTGSDNTFFGYRSGEDNTAGSNNTAFGYTAGAGLTDGNDNTAVGYSALRGAANGSKVTGYGNSVIGYDAAHYLTSGVHNTLLGSNINFITAGNFNTLVGVKAGASLADTDYNTFVGAQAGWTNDRSSSANSANRNTALGAFAAYDNKTGADNLFIGTGADASESEIFKAVGVGIGAEVTRDEGIALGQYTDAKAAGAISLGGVVSDDQSINIGLGSTSIYSNSLLLGDSDTLSWDAASDATVSLGNSDYRFSGLISANIVSVADTDDTVSWVISADAAEDNGDTWQISAVDDGQFNISNNISGSQSNTLSINKSGDLTIAGVLYLNSDARLKKKVNPIDKALSATSRLSAVHYDFIKESDSTSKHLGLIAQQVESIFPNIVKTEKSGRKTVNYIALVPFLVESLKELAEQNKSRRAQLEQLKARRLKLQRFFELQTSKVSSQRGEQG
ncbi:tail fiber domain-containing protein [Aliikangiella coralliicola]|uniref:Tail fiber domain-containing protein n=1 Tax=Aliikangiella coralliicola TaxID=2592383 RepID=A0A545UF33_9GAMM|nr:tail fiber domain-containing protein [Aliikangiella coralliicola]TQV88074.1 tail fiber domain-containing protein [Aliikangiella coralliicola]